ncbi:sulfotransferase family protein [Spirillospora sp. CA-294931]|uniref:sulfotransferase family protein n=1 Tax=Spirillospora sp. CA-294931 TaxID=3240042 RepID=UPI003D89E88B
MDQHTMAFVGGLHRSGTTLLASLMADHPQISGFRNTGAPEDEGQHLQTVCPIDEHHGGPGRFAFTPEAHMTETSPFAAPEPARRLREQWERYWDLSRPVLLEKSPPNLLRFRFLQEVFPNSRFILMMRHPVPVTLSTLKWAPALTPRRLVEHWIHAHEIALQDTLRLEHCMTVRYENLMARPAATMAEIAEFLGLPDAFDAGRVDPKVNRDYFARWRALASGGGLGEGLDALESAVNTYGYSLSADAPRGSSSPLADPWRS